MFLEQFLYFKRKLQFYEKDYTDDYLTYGRSATETEYGNQFVAVL